MLHSAHTKMPAIDYVSIISSLYKDKRAILLGTCATAVAAGAAAIESSSWLLLFHALAFIVIAIVRLREASIFQKNPPTEDDVQSALVWERRAMICGGMAALNYGLWCFSSLVLVQTPFAELAAVSVSVAALVGVVARNFGLQRLVVLQSILVGLPLCLGLAVAGDIYHFILATLFAPMMMSFLSVARDVREVFLSAVHDRVEVTKLARELDTAMATLSHGVCMLNLDLMVAVANPQFGRILFGDATGDLVGLNFRELLRKAESSDILSKLSSERLVTALVSPESSKLVLQLANGTNCEVFINSSEDQIALVVEDISERLENETRIRYMARYDALTSLPNRAYSSEQIEARLARANLATQFPNSMLMIIDVDDFKHINDTMGHPVGDRLLEMVAHRIRQNLDSSVIVGRFGGDEFTIFDDRDVDQFAAEAMAGRLANALNEPYVIHEESLLVRFSMGFVISSHRESKLDSLFKRADLALYAAKAAGKGQVHAFKPEMDRNYQYRQVLKRALKDTIAQGDLSLVFQPIVDTKTGRINSCEALARWHHPEHGSIPPSIFIPIAEEIGVISDVTQWVIKMATETCMTWPKSVSVSVNVSGRDFKNGLLVDMVREALDHSRLPANRLVVEVTESALIDERDHAAQLLQDVADMGAGIALDDFGTGYSSLAYVHDLPFNKLKIDRSFTSGVTKDEKSLKLLRSIAHMSKELDLTVTVEGVETDEQLDLISSLGMVDEIQGFLFGAPMPAREILALIEAMQGGNLNENRNTLVSRAKNSA